MRPVVGRLPGEPALQLHDVGLGGVGHLLLGQVRVLQAVLLLWTGEEGGREGEKKKTFFPESQIKKKKRKEKLEICREW